MNRNFQKVQWYITVGISPVKDTCCVYIDDQPPPATLQPRFDRKYIARVVFTFKAPKKTVYNALISNLRTCGIDSRDKYDQLSPPANPDNKFYTNLPGDKLQLIIEIIRLTIAGMSIEICDGLPAAVYSETNVATEQFNNAIRREQSQMMSLDFYGALILNPNGTLYTHNFKIE